MHWKKSVYLVNIGLDVVGWMMCSGCGKVVLCAVACLGSRKGAKLCHPLVYHGTMSPIVTMLSRSDAKGYIREKIKHFTQIAQER